MSTAPSRSRADAGHASAPTPLHRARRLGMTGVLVSYGGLVLLWMLCVPVFGTWDEAANVDYSLQLSQGRIPVADSYYEAAFPDLGQNARGQYVSNHAPLYHLVVSPFVSLAESSEHARAFLLLARATSAVLGGLAVVVVGMTVRALFARAPKSATLAMVAAAGVMATVPEVVAAAGAHRNDVMTALLASLTTLVLVRAIRTGLSTRTVLVVALLCALGMLTRISFLPVWIMACGGVAVLSAWPQLRLRRPVAKDVAVGIVRAAAVAAVTLLGAGWFYALNLRRYGDLTGGSALYPRVARRDYAPGAEEGPISYLFTPTTWWTQLQQLGGIRSTVQPDDHVVHTVIAVLLLTVLGTAAVATVLRVGGRGRPLLDRTGRWQLLALAVLGAGTVATLASHVAHKGAENQRYLINAIAFWGTGAALLLLAFRHRAVPVAACFVTGLLTVGTVIYTVERIQDLEIRGTSWFGTLVAGFEHTGTPAGAPVVAGLLTTAVVGLALQLVALTAASRVDDDASPQSGIDPA